MTADCCDYDAEQPTKRQVVVELQRAYMALIAGTARIRVRYDKRWTEYHPANASHLYRLCNVLYDQLTCDEQEGISDLRPERGRGIFLRLT